MGHLESTWPLAPQREPTRRGFPKSFFPSLLVTLPPPPPTPSKVSYTVRRPPPSPLIHLPIIRTSVGEGILSFQELQEGKEKEKRRQKIIIKIERKAWCVQEKDGTKFPAKVTRLLGSFVTTVIITLTSKLNASSHSASIDSMAWLSVRRIVSRWRLIHDRMTWFVPRKWTTISLNISSMTQV